MAMITKYADKAKVKLWVDALRSGDYEQAQGQLKDENRFCCLGVLCDISNLDDFSWEGDTFVDDNRMDSAITELPTEVSKWLGIGNFNTNPDLIGKDGSTFSAAYLNDSAGYTFDEIADAVERTFLND